MGGFFCFPPPWTAQGGDEIQEGDIPTLKRLGGIIPWFLPCICSWFYIWVIYVYTYLVIYLSHWFVQQTRASLDQGKQTPQSNTILHTHMRALCILISSSSCFIQYIIYIYILHGNEYINSHMLYVHCT